MAESGESGGKASDLFLGVVDLFAVILPGALFSGLVWKVLSHSEVGRKLLERVAGPEFVPKWLVLLVAAYIIGHFLFALGAWIMDPLYDGYYKRKFEFEVKKELPSMRRRADRLFNQVLGKELYGEDDNRLTWSESFLRFGGAAAMGQLDRLEADSKFFRSLAVVAILSPLLMFSPLNDWITGWRIWIWLAVTVIAIVLVLRAPLVGLLTLLFPRIRRWRARRLSKEDMLVRIKRRLLNDTHCKPTQDQLVSRFAWTDSEWLKAEASENQESKARFLWKAILLPGVWTLLVAALTITANCRDGWTAGIFCWLLALLSAWRYMEIRAKRLTQAYYFAIALNKSGVFSGTSAEKK
jgi:hypothetical protein